MSDYLNYITGTHTLYDKYYSDWRLCINSYHGGPEYKDAHYLRAYQVDFNTPSEMVNTYERADDGSYVAKFQAKVVQGSTRNATVRGQDKLSGSFYEEKLDAVPWYNYVKLITNEYNSILFRNPPQRMLGDDVDMSEFMENVDGEGNSLSEFMSQVDVLTTVYGVLHIGCYKPFGSDIPKFKIHTPEDVTNWSYAYNPDGSLTLDSMVIRIENSDYHSVYRVLSREHIDTIFVKNDNSDEDYMPPVDSPDLEMIEEGTYRIRQENELGYIPVVTVYQNVKVYNNVGSTIIMDVAQIQRSVYGDSAEIYSAITYGAHPTLLVDESTDALNDGQVNAEPGGIVRVPGGLTGDQQNYVYQFASPSLDAITEIRDLIDNKINKLTQIAMLRSEDLIKASNSGNQIEVFDDKLAALIRKKATNLENAESKLFDIYFDWTNQQKPDNFRVSYSRQYNKRALETELKEIDVLINVVNKYEEMFGNDQIEAPSYSTEAEAIAEANRLGGTGAHEHVQEDGSSIYMPFETHELYEAAIGMTASEPDFKNNMRDKIRTRLEELMSSTSTNKGL